MRAYVPDFEMVTKATLPETLKMMSAEPTKWKVFAGGTDLMVLFEAGRLKHFQFLNLLPFSELKKIEITEHEVRIGSLCTFAEIQNHPIIQKEFPLLVKSGSMTGAKAIQNRGTLGGNIANASPAADTPPSLFAYGAKIELRNSLGQRTLNYDEFHLSYKQTRLQPDEIISAVLLPRHQGWTHQYYRKVGTRAFQAISKIAVSMAAKIETGRIEKIHFGFASLAPTPLRASSLEQALRGQKVASVPWKQIAKDFAGTLSPVDDIRSNAKYRQSVTQRLVEQSLKTLTNPPGFFPKDEESF